MCAGPLEKANHSAVVDVYLSLWPGVRCKAGTFDSSKKESFLQIWRLSPTAAELHNLNIFFVFLSTVSAVYSAVLPLSLMVFLVLGRSRAPLAWWPIIASIIDGACSRFSCWVGQPTMAPAKRWSIISVFHKLESKWPSQDCLSGMIGDLYQLIKAVVQKGKFSPSVWSCVVALISFLESRSQN